MSMSHLSIPRVTLKLGGCGRGCQLPGGLVEAEIAKPHPRLASYKCRNVVSVDGME